MLRCLLRHRAAALWHIFHQLWSARRICACSQWIIVLLVLWTTQHSLHGKESTFAGRRASTSHKSRLNAIRSIPLKNISPRYRRRVHQVLSDSSLYRRLPTQMVDCNPQLFTFLAKNPEMLVEIWREMGISRVDLVRSGSNTFQLTDNAGTTCELIIVEQKCDQRAQNRIVMYSDGSYEGKPFKRPVRAQCVMLLRTGSIKETNGRDYVAARLDTFIRIDRASIELFAKAVHPLVGRTADANFGDTMAFVSTFSQAAERQPETVQKLVNGLPRVSRARRQELERLAWQCGSRQLPTLKTATSGTLVKDELR